MKVAYLLESEYAREILGYVIEDEYKDLLDKYAGDDSGKRELMKTALIE